VPRLPRRRAAAPLAVAVPWSLLELQREGPAALADRPAPGAGDPLRVAVVVPAFRRGSGGHSTIAHLLRGLEARGHACSVWVADDEGRHAGESEAEVAESFRAFFGPVDGRVRLGFDAWEGADVVVATGWQTVPRVLRLGGAVSRAYLVQDHEPDFHGASAERVWAEETYRAGLHCIAASPWLAALLSDRYGASASAFDLGVDHAVYGPRPVHRRSDLLLVYARAVTPRRAVPLALLAAAELKRRRPKLEVALFGEARPLAVPFDALQLGVLDGEDLVHAYNSATVGLVLSTTNPSLVPTEMLACALPCVDLASPSMIRTFGCDGPVTLAPFDPLAIADAVDGLVDDLELRAEKVRAGLDLAAGRTWPRAAEQVEAGLRRALREREA
jgi:glycosyltransferase involved in cell wall biosynthesis